MRYFKIVTSRENLSLSSIRWFWLWQTENNLYISLSKNVLTFQEKHRIMQHIFFNRNISVFRRSPILFNKFLAKINRYQLCIQTYIYTQKKIGSRIHHISTYFHGSNLIDFHSISFVHICFCFKEICYHYYQAI